MLFFIGAWSKWSNVPIYNSIPKNKQFVINWCVKTNNKKNDIAIYRIEITLSSCSSSSSTSSSIKLDVIATSGAWSGFNHPTDEHVISIRPCSYAHFLLRYSNVALRVDEPESGLSLSHMVQIHSSVLTSFVFYSVISQWIWWWPFIGYLFRAPY